MAINTSMKKIPFIAILIVLFLMFFAAPVALITAASMQAPHYPQVIEEVNVDDQ